jgi:hypothetical protein
MLDATAGNRMIWGENKTPHLTVFMDIETRLFRPPDIFGSSTHCPFREEIFDVVLFDPPWGINMPPWWNKPEIYNKNYGGFKSKRELLSYIHKSQKEFIRVAPRLCLKWGERNVSLWKILVCFKSNWREIFRRETGGIKSKTKNYWVTFVKKSQFKENEKNG